MRLPWVPLSFSSRDEEGSEEDNTEQENDGSSEVPTEEKGKEKRENTARRANDGAAPEKILGAIGEEPYGGSRSNEETESEKGPDGLKGGDEGEDDEREAAVAERASGKSLGSGRARVEEEDEQGTPKEGDEENGERSGEVRDPEVGVAHAHDVAEEPIIHLLLETEMHEDDITGGESYRMDDGEGDILVQNAGGSGDEKGAETDQKTGKHRTDEHAPMSESEKQDAQSDPRQQGAGDGAYLKRRTPQQHEGAQKAIREAHHGARPKAALSQWFAEELEEVIHRACWVEVDGRE